MRDIVKQIGQFITAADAASQLGCVDGIRLDLNFKRESQRYELGSLVNEMKTHPCLGLSLRLEGGDDQLATVDVSFALFKEDIPALRDLLKRLNLLDEGTP